MKKIVALIPLLLFGCFLVHAQKSKKKITPTVVSGKLIPGPPKGIFLLQHHGKVDTVRVGTDGTFRLSIEQADANYYTVQIGKQNISLYLLPLDSFSMTLNGNMPSASPLFEGISAPYCYYLLQQKSNAKDNQMTVMSQLMSGPFISEMDSVKKKMNLLLEKESAKHHFISPFVESEKKAIDYKLAFYNLVYMYQNEQQGTVSFPEKISSLAMHTSIEDEAMRYHEAFQTYATNCINYKANQKYVNLAEQTYAKYCELKVEEVCAIKSQAVRDALFQTVMQQILQDAGANDLRKAVAKFSACCSDENLVAKVNAILSQYTSIYPGELAPDAVCFDSTGKTMRLSDYRGKVLYIDTWATWCGPCKREIPELKKLEAEFHGKNIEFLSISTDQDVGKWKAFLSKQEMTGNQLHQSENFDESVSKLYMVNSIPRFIIIDEQGKIVSADAPRPSSGQQIRNMLNGVLAD